MISQGQPTPVESPLDREALFAAFAMFEEAAERIGGSYEDLEARVAGLRAQLERSDARGQRELVEKDRLSARLHNVLKVMPAGVVVLDGEGRIREVNPIANQLLGGVEIGALWRDVAAHVFAPCWDDGHDITLVTGRRVNLSTQALDGEPGQLLLMTDVTETRRLQEQLSRYKRLSAQGEMAAALAHQVRTPLAAALLYVSNLSRTDLDGTTRERFADKALGRLRDLERLVEDMLLYARGGAFDVQTVELRAVIDDLVRDFAPVAARSEFTVAVNDAAGGARIRANRPALRSVLLNLAENALAACGGRGRLDIALTRDALGNAVLRVADEGPGIPAELRERVFEPFFTTRSGGTGLGLAITQSVIRCHGGEIVLDGDAARGTCFQIVLPAVPEAGAEAA